MRIRRVPLPLLLVLVASCAPRAGQIPPGSEGGTAAAASAPALGIDLTEAATGGRPSGAASGGEASRSPPAAPPEAKGAVASGAPAPGAPVPDVAHAELASPEFASAVASVPSPDASAGSRERLVVGARQLVGRPFKGDCTGFVRRVIDGAQVRLPRLHSARTMTESLYRSLPHVRRPRPGDLAFFHATRSRDRTGSARSRFTHVAMVEKVEGARVTLIHRGSRGIRRFAMNLERPHDRRENGMMRRRRVRDAPGTRYLAAELFSGYATPLGAMTPAGGAVRGEAEPGEVSRTASGPGRRRDRSRRSPGRRAVRERPGDRSTAETAERAERSPLRSPRAPR
jgi:hypothetical protein